MLLALLTLACTSGTTGTGTDSVTPGHDTDTATTTDPAPACDALDTWADGLEPSRELHVATTGSDTAGDGSSGSPFATLVHAVDQATPGTAVRVHAGSFGNAYLEDVYGTADAPIWIGGAPGEEPPVLVGASEGLHLSGGAWLVVHDLVIDSARDNGVNFDDRGDYDDPEALHHVIFQRLEVRDIGGDGNQDCLKLSGLRDFHVLDSSFADCGGGSSGSGVDMVGCHRGVIARNHFTRTSGNAVQAKGGTDDVLLLWNRLVDAGARGFNLGGSTGTEFFRPPLDPEGENFEARDLRAVGNWIEGSEASLAFVGCVDCSATHNTLVDPDKWLFRILQESVTDADYSFLAAGGGAVMNNLVVFARDAVSTDVNIGPDTDPDSFSWSHNLFYASDAPGDSAPELPGTVVGSLIGVDPGLDADGLIGPDSPAVGAGVSGTGVMGDRLGACYEEPPSIGSVEGADR